MSVSQHEARVFCVIISGVKLARFSYNNCLHLPGAVLEEHCAQPFIWVLDLELRPSRLQDKNFPTELSPHMLCPFLVENKNKTLNAISPSLSKSDQVGFLLFV